MMRWAFSQVLWLFVKLLAEPVAQLIINTVLIQSIVWMDLHGCCTLLVTSVHSRAYLLMKWATSVSQTGFACLVSSLSSGEFIWEGRLECLPRSQLLEKRSWQAGQLAFSYKHNKNSNKAWAEPSQAKWASPANRDGLVTSSKQALSQKDT